MADLPDACEGVPFRDTPKDSIWAVKSSRRFVVSLSLYERRGVGDGVRSDRRTVEGVICARARGVACGRVRWVPNMFCCLHLRRHSLWGFF